MQKIEKFTIGECSIGETLTTKGCISTIKLRSCPTSLSSGTPGSSDYVTYTEHTIQDSKTGDKKGIKCTSSLNPEMPTSAKCSISWNDDVKLVGDNNSISAPQNSCYVNYISGTPNCEEEYNLTTKKGINMCTKSGNLDKLPTYTYICPRNTTLDTSTGKPYCLI